MIEIYPSRAYDSITDLERQAVDEYVIYAVERQRAKHAPVSQALNLPIPSEYIKRSREALTRPTVLAAVAERIAEESALYDVSPDKVVKEYAEIAFSDVTEFLRESPMGVPELKPIEDIQLLSKSHAIKSIECKPSMMGTQWRVVMHDKFPALKALADMMGLTTPDQPPVLKEYVREELRTTDKQDLEAPEAEYTELLEYVNKEGA